MEHISACIFDLDGVVVDTAKYHYIAWKRLAKELGFDFLEKDNERLKGISRLDSLNILLEIGNINLSQDEKERLAAKKNDWYLEYILQMNSDEILPGVKEFIEELEGKGVKIGLGSASKNARLILERIGLIHHFKTIVDGTRVAKAKPDPEIFLLAARDLNAHPKDCVVFEDAEAGIESAISGGFKSIGIGDPSILYKANVVIPNFTGLTYNKLISLMKQL